jgi:membrane-associated phospholipid phosphatase
LRIAVRAAATGGLAAAACVPLVRRRLRIRPALTTCAVAAGPVAAAVLRPRTRARDAILFALQMWAFTIAHELPYDDPERLRRRLRVRYPIAVDRAIGLGELPTIRLQGALGTVGRVTALDRALSVVHWAWFVQPHLALAYILARHPDRFPRAARQMSGVYDLGCAVYFAVPTAPPWWAAEEGYIEGPVERVPAAVAQREALPVRRIMVDVGERAWGRAWPRLYDSLGGNPWAAMPSLHFATSLMAALLLAEEGRGPGAVAWAYALTLGVALVYLGEHYVTDLLAGSALVLAVRRGDRFAEMLVGGIGGAVERLEGIANA